MGRKIGMFAFVMVAAACLALLGPKAWGQATTSLRGTVTDSSGAAVPNAKVTLTNAATNVPRQTTSNGTGAYTFAAVLPGSYDLKVEANGFETYAQSGVLLQVNLPATVNVALKIGATTQTVEVKGQAPLLNQTNATMGQTMGTSAIENLPITQENTVLLLSLQSGVEYNGDKILTDSYDTRAGAVNGERGDQNNITLDGVSDNNEFAGYAFNGILPTTPFSVEEFRVTTSNYGATEGRSAGAQISMVTKGGTNQFHGSLYEFNRNTLGEANDYFLKSSEAASDTPNIPEHLVWNNYGGTVGGPILKNRFFFFFNYEGHRQSVGQSVERAIPSATLRDGIIQYGCATPSQCAGMNVAGISGNSYAIPAGMYALNATQLAQMDPLGVGPSPVMLQYFNTFPEPNDVNYGDAPNFAGYRFAAPTMNKDNWYIGRLDYKLTENGNHTLFFRGEGIDDSDAGAPFLPGQIPEATSKDLAKGFVAGYTGVFGPHLVNSFRYGLTRDSFGSNGNSNLPWVFVRDLDQGVNYSNGDTAPVHNFADTVSWMKDIGSGIFKGSHNFQFGLNFLLSRLNTWSTQGSFSDALTNADWTFQGGFANKNDSFNPDFGCSSGGPCYPAVAANFNHSYDFPLAGLIGMASEVDAVYNYKVTSLTAATPLNQGDAVYRHWAVDDYNLFFEDTWQARRNLSVTYGLNYQLMTPMTETTGQQVSPSVDMGTWFNERAMDMAKGIPETEVNGGQPIAFEPSGSSYGRPGLYNRQTKNFAPRIGFAWTPEASGGFLEHLTGNDKTVIRGGFGMYYDNFGPELATHYSASGEFGLATTLSNPAATETIQCAPRVTSMNAIPTTDNCGNTVMIPAPASNFPVVYPQGIEAIADGIDQSMKTPYSYAMDLSVERQLPGNMTLDVAYVGHLGHRLLAYDDVATPMDLVDPTSKIDYFTAAKQLSTMWRNNVPESGVDAAIGPTAAYWQDMLASKGSYTLCSTGGSTTDLIQAVYDVFGPGCGDLYNETSGLYLLDVAGFPTQPVSGLNSFFDGQYSSLWDWRSMGWSNYHSLQVSLHKQMSHGLLFGANYTYSHSNDIASESERGVHYLTDSIINPWSPQQMYGSSDFDLRHQINGYWVAQLPFGQGQRFGGGVNGWENALIGGWQLSGTIRWTTGFPVSVFQGYVWPTNWDEMGWSDLTGAPVATGTESTATGVPNIFKNPSAAANGFAYAFPGESGARNPIRGDGFFGFDGNLQKQWRIPKTERQSLEARWSVFNVLNTNRFDAFSMQDEWDSASTFGNYSSTLTNPRVMELALIYQF